MFKRFSKCTIILHLKDHDSVCDCKLQKHDRQADTTRVPSLTRLKELQPRDKLSQPTQQQKLWPASTPLNHRQQASRPTCTQQTTVDHGMGAALPRTPAQQPLQPLQPRPKAAATTSKSVTFERSSSPSSFPSAIESVKSTTNAKQPASDYLSDKATAALIRKTLCPPSTDKNTSVLDLLPPLSSSNAVDLQLYALISIIVREFIYVWYTKITPDQVFVEEIVKVIAHVTTGLEERLRKVDLEALLFDELPELLEAHTKGKLWSILVLVWHDVSMLNMGTMCLRWTMLISRVAYRIAYHSIRHDPLEYDPRLTYHSLWPNPALSPVPWKDDPVSVLLQKENEAAYRQLLVQGVLAVLLPTEDLNTDLLTSLVGGILSDMILGNGVGGKASEPWLIWESITKIAEVVKTKLPGSRAQARVEKSASHDTSGQTTLSRSGRLAQWQRTTQKTLWLLLQYFFLAITTARFIIVTIATSSSIPSRMSQIRKTNKSPPVAASLQPPSEDRSSSRKESPPTKTPLIQLKIWTFTSSLLDLAARMPWLSGALSLMQWFLVTGPGELGATDGMIDR